MLALRSTQNTESTAALVHTSGTVLARRTIRPYYYRVIRYEHYVCHKRRGRGKYCQLNARLVNSKRSWRDGLEKIPTLAGRLPHRENSPMTDEVKMRNLRNVVLYSRRQAHWAARSFFILREFHNPGCSAGQKNWLATAHILTCLLYTSPSPRD